MVDDRGELPTPCFVTSTLACANLDRTDLTDAPEPAVRALAGSIGRNLGAPHDQDAVGGFGTVTVDRREQLDGDRHAAHLDTLTVQQPTDEWTHFLRSDVHRLLEELDDTRFSDLSPAIRASLAETLDDLTDDHDPVTARIDQSLENAIIDPETGVVTGLLDWEFPLATTPAYDLAFVEHSLAGGLWKLLPQVRDRQRTIRRALLDGYRERGSTEVVHTFQDNHACYALLTGLHAMVNFQDWFDQVGDVRSERQDEAADRLRAFVEKRC